MTSPFQAYNDLRIAGRDLRGAPGFTLSAIIRNELYFLPSFLDHYRALGVGRFILLDDRSDDGSVDYLAGQPDVMILNSQHRYGDRVEMPPELASKLSDNRMVYIWRALLLEMIGNGQWSIHVDADEFVRLPDGISFPDLAPRLEREGVEAAWGVMLDMYPRNVSNLRAASGAAHFDPRGAWYFDGEPHLRLRQGRAPTNLHPGCRARLANQYDVGFQGGMLARMKQRRFGLRIPRLNTLRKPVLLKWREGAFFESSHIVNLNASTRMLLPIQHFKFTGELRARTDAAIREGAHYAGSRDYVVMSALLEKMEADGGSFLYRHSTRATDFAAFARTGNALGLTE